MKRIKIEPIGDRNTLMQSPPEVLVEIIVRQQQMIEQLVEEVERLKQRGKWDSQSSSTPPLVTCCNAQKNRKRSGKQKRMVQNGESQEDSPGMWVERVKDLDALIAMRCCDRNSVTNVVEQNLSKFQ
jgi:hypothetical protein